MEEPTDKQRLDVLETLSAVAWQNVHRAIGDRNISLRDAADGIISYRGNVYKWIDSLQWRESERWAA